MAEKITSSQESLPLSQETFQQLFSLIEYPLRSCMEDNSEITQVQDATYSDLINNMSKIAQTGCNMFNGYSRNNSVQQTFVEDDNCLIEESQCKLESLDFNSIAIPNQYLPPQKPVSSLPASENWPGEFQFSVSFNEQQEVTKQSSWVFSQEKNKLYVAKGVACPVNFTTICAMPEEISIRAMALFSRSDQAIEKVTRCINHSMEDIKKNIPIAEHFVRCESQRACYEKDTKTERHSVVVPFENPPAGQCFSTYLYKFMCFGSCSGGPNRRPLMLVFTLERGGEVIGRQKIDLKVCACPQRDFKSEQLKSGQPVSESRMKPSKRPSTDKILLNLPKKMKKDDEKVYTIQETNKKCFKFLKKMQLLYNLYSSVKGQPEWKNFYVFSQSSSSEDTQ